MVSTTIKIKLLHEDAKIPTKAYPGDLGWDLYSPHDIELGACSRVTIPIGIATSFPEEFGVILRDRSSYAAKGIFLHGGVIDAAYRGEWSIVLENNSPRRHEIRKGDRIAQLILIRNEPVIWYNTEELPSSHRNDGGFGSSGN